MRIFSTTRPVCLVSQTSLNYLKHVCSAFTELLLYPSLLKTQLEAATAVCAVLLVWKTANGLSLSGQERDFGEFDFALSMRIFPGCYQETHPRHHFSIYPVCLPISMNWGWGSKHSCLLKLFLSKSQVLGNLCDKVHHPVWSWIAQRGILLLFLSQFLAVSLVRSYLRIFYWREDFY